MSTTVKLSAETMAIMKNFAAISGSQWFKQGSEIKTRSSSREVYALAKISETLPADFAVYDLPRLLNVVGLFGDEAELTFGEIDNGVIVGAGRNKVKYVFSDPIIMPQNCVTPEEYEKNPRIPPQVGAFTLKSDQLDKVKKAASVLGNPNISIVSDGTTVSLITHDLKNKLSDQFILEVEGATVDKAFQVDLKLETLRLIPGEYEITVAEKIVVHFKHATLPVEYYICGQITVS